MTADDMVETVAVEATDIVSDTVPGIIYNASTKSVESTSGEATEPEVVITEHVDNVDVTLDYAIELEIANNKILEYEITVANLTETIAILKNENAALAAEVAEFKLGEQIKSLIASIMTIDPEIDSNFVTSLTIDQLTILNASLVRVFNK